MQAHCYQIREAQSLRNVMSHKLMTALPQTKQLLSQQRQVPASLLVFLPICFPCALWVSTCKVQFNLETAAPVRASSAAM